ncbi:hypothetical protein PGTUg99_030951 [Puccinia graminis f. sp. tritici]|uniref:Uncharacterized protein n=1 Tax=Puccinia graminis f. sp. tritici TaxID=56615 RepID=A0A5B0N181_PUCGR|nr:hypothetical protein PGTUg99_030951 [Puccinia graminis f. sp. tritici]
MDDYVIKSTLAALAPLPPQILQLFAYQFVVLEDFLFDLDRNPLRDGLTDDQYNQFLGVFSPEINEAFANMDESVKAPLRSWLGYWRCQVRRLHKSRRASFASRQTRVHQLFDSLTISNATAAAASTDGEALECKICQEEIVQAGQTLARIALNLPYLPGYN